MKKIILLIIIITSSFITKAQWSGGTDLTSLTSRTGSVSLTSPTSYLSLGNALYFGQSGNAPDGFPYGRFIENYGIRFGSPNSTWVLSTKTSFLAGFQPAGEDWGMGNIYASNKIAIGTNLLPQQLTLTGGIGFANFNAWDKKLYASNDGVLEWMTHDAAAEHGFTISHQGQRRVFLNTNGDSYLNGGRVGIGTANPDAMLAVAGQVHATEVRVTNNVPGPDYVFEKDYKLTSLEEIKNYIDQNKHLPEVPSAKEMEKNGVQLGEMNMLLLKKIEELTLYVIEQNKRIDDQQIEIKELKTLLRK